MDGQIIQLQFRSAQRAILSHVGVSPSHSANCTVDTSNDILMDCTDDSAELFDDSAVALSDHSYLSMLPTLSQYVKDVSSYIAGFVVRKLLPKLKCDECRGLLVDTHSCDTDMFFIRLKIMEV